MAKRSNGAPIGDFIKKYIKYRNKTINEVAYDMGIKNTTFSEQLLNDSLKVDTLFKLAVYLDMDLEWMLYALGYAGKTNTFESEKVLRIRDANFRAEEKKKVMAVMDELIIELNGNTNAVRKELFKEFGSNSFYLLDVLINEEFDIHIMTDRSGKSYLVDTHERSQIGRSAFSRSTTLMKEKEALEIVIEDRKEELGYENSIL